MSNKAEQRRPPKKLVTGTNQPVYSEVPATDLLTAFYKSPTIGPRAPSQQAVRNEPYDQQRRAVSVDPTLIPTPPRSPTADTLQADTRANAIASQSNAVASSSPPVPSHIAQSTHHPLVDPTPLYANNHLRKDTQPANLAAVSSSLGARLSTYASPGVNPAHLAGPPTLART
jgi:hypothetical protein